MLTLQCRYIYSLQCLRWPPISRESSAHDFAITSARRVLGACAFVILGHKARAKLFYYHSAVRWADLRRALGHHSIVPQSSHLTVLYILSTADVQRNLQKIKKNMFASMLCCTVQVQHWLVLVTTGDTRHSIHCAPSLVTHSSPHCSLPLLSCVIYNLTDFQIGDMRPAVTASSSTCY